MNDRQATSPGLLLRLVLFFGERVSLAVLELDWQIRLALNSCAPMPYFGAEILEFLHHTVTFAHFFICHPDQFFPLLPHFYFLTYEVHMLYSGKEFKVQTLRAGNLVAHT